MDKKILIDATYQNNVQVAVVEDNKLEEIEYTSTVKDLIRGNIYLAKVTRIEPALQAAFIDYGEEKHGFIPFSEIHPDYYNIPSKYKQMDEQRQDVVRDDQKASEEDAYNKMSVDKSSVSKDFTDEVLEDEVGNILSNYEADIERAKRQNAERYKIQEVLKRNQILLVQAVKEVRGNKGAMFTTYTSLAGKYCVLMPNSLSGGGISRRISESEDRKKLQKIFDEISKTSQLSFIIRTAGQGHNKDEIKRDYSYLVKLWNGIREKTLSSNAPAFIHSEDDILKKAVRDLYDRDTKEIIMQGDEAYKNVLAIVKSMALTKHVRITKYEGNMPIFNKFNVNEQISSLYNPTISLRSGAHIVINQTEALTAIDVNSGRSTSERNIEGTAVKTNIEAAKEIARQIRLRDLSGLIVIDFIDMIESRNRRIVEKTFRDLIKRDKARIQIGHISHLGLFEMSRQRLRPSFLEANTIPCTHCKGRGTIKSDETNSIMVFRTIESELTAASKIESLHVHLSPQTALFMLNHKREEIRALEQKYKVSLYILQDVSMGSDNFAMETVNRVSNQSSLVADNMYKEKYNKEKLVYNNKDARVHSNEHPMHNNVNHQVADRIKISNEIESSAVTPKRWNSARKLKQQVIKGEQEQKILQQTDKSSKKEQVVAEMRRPQKKSKKSVQPTVHAHD